jgi:hypothetical protein
VSSDEVLAAAVQVGALDAVANFHLGNGACTRGPRCHSPSPRSRLYGESLQGQRMAVQYGSAALV